MNTSTSILTNRSAFVIYGWLIALTLLEVWIVKAGIPRTAGVILMGGTTLGKVLMIALYFMHVKHERPIAWLLPAIPIVLAVLFVLALFPDLVYHLPLRFQ